jgi:5-aminolevulinate synthase
VSRTAFPFDDYFAEANEKLRRNHLYRTFRELQRAQRAFPHVTWHTTDGPRPLTVWCSNDYLGMSQHPRVIAAAHRALDDYGTGAGGTRAISGTSDLLNELERELAQVHRKESALVFSSGYVANEAALQTLAAGLPECIVLSDAANHASIIAGIRASKRTCRMFRHNDVAHLEALLRELNPDTPKIVVLESLYSMDGDIAPLAELLAAAKQHGALTYVDETHAVGVYDAEGGGIITSRGLDSLVDVTQGGLGKGYGAVGGFIAGHRATVDFIRSHASGFIFTTALPPATAAAALASVQHLRTSAVERNALFARVARLRNALHEAAVPIAATPSQILPLIVGDAQRCQALAERLANAHGIYLQAIVYPTVPRDGARLRITPSPLHDDQDQERLVHALATECRDLQISVAA